MEESKVTQKIICKQIIAGFLAICIFSQNSSSSVGCEAFLDPELGIDRWQNSYDLEDNPSFYTLRGLLKSLQDDQDIVYHAGDPVPLRGNYFLSGNMMDGRIDQGANWSSTIRENRNNLNFQQAANVLKTIHDQVYLYGARMEVKLNPFVSSREGKINFLEKYLKAVNHEIEKHRVFYNNAQDKHAKKIQKGREEGFRSVILGLIEAGILYDYFLHYGEPTQRPSLFAIIVGLVFISSITSYIKYKKVFTNEYLDTLYGTNRSSSHEAVILYEFIKQSMELMTNGKNGDFVLTSLPQEVSWRDEKSNPKEEQETTGRMDYLTFVDQNNEPHLLIFFKSDPPNQVSSSKELAKNFGMQESALVTFDPPGDFRIPFDIGPLKKTKEYRMPTKQKILLYSAISVALAPPSYLVYLMLSQ